MRRDLRANGAARADEEGSPEDLGGGPLGQGTLEQDTDGGLFWSGFLGKLNHEVRTLVSSVLGLTSLVLDSDLNAQQRENLTKVRTAAKNLLLVINEMLDLSKMRTGRLGLSHSVFELQVVLDKLIDIAAEQTATRQQELVVYADPSLPAFLKGDAGRLLQVLTGLVDFCLQHTSGGEVLVHASRGEAVTGAISGQFAMVFSIMDTGSRISDEALSRFFEAGMPGDGKKAADRLEDGMGLFICRHLVLLMGGKIAAERPPEGGVRLTFDIQAETVPEAPSVETIKAAPGAKVLVVTAGEALGWMLTQTLETMGYAVRLVRDRQGAVQWAGQQVTEEPFSLVLLDWDVDGGHGGEIADDLVRHGRTPGAPGPRIVALIHARELAQVHGRLRSGMVDAYLAKPIKRMVLVQALREVAGEKEAPRPQEVWLSEEDTLLERLRRLTGQRVLLVEDSVFNRDVARAYLQSAGLTVDIAENGLQAVERVRKAQGCYGAVLMDLQMPEMDGYAATGQIRAFPFAANLPIIALTAHSFTGEHEKCLDAGMDDYLTKPYRAADLYRVLLRWMDSAGAEDDGENATEPESTGGEVIASDAAVLDPEAALARLDGKKGLLLRMLEVFAREFAAVAHAVRESMGREDRDTALRLAHTIKGSSAHIGAMALSRAAAELEWSIRSERGTVESELVDFECALEKTLRAVEAYLREQAGSPGASGRINRRESLPNGEMDAMFAELAVMLEQGNTRSVLLWERLQPVLAEMGLQRESDDFQHRLDRFDFPGAANALSAILIGYRKIRAGSAERT